MKSTETYIPPPPCGEYSAYLIAGSVIFMSGRPIKNVVKNSLVNKIDDVVDRALIGSIASGIAGGASAYVFKSLYSESITVPKVVVIVGGFLGFFGSLLWWSEDNKKNESTTG